MSLTPYKREKLGAKHERKLETKPETKPPEAVKVEEKARKQKNGKK